MKDGWYYIKTWDKMEKEFGINNYGDINIKFRFTRKMEELLPPSRCIYVKKDEWKPRLTGDREEILTFYAYSILDDMVECPAIPIGARVHAWDGSNSKTSGIYCGYTFYNHLPHKIHDDYTGTMVSYKFAEIKNNTEISVKVNGKDISEETLKKIIELIEGDKK